MPPLGPAAAKAAASALATATGVTRHDVAVVLGSGWAAASGLLGDPRAELPLTDLPGFPAPSVSGHVNLVRSLTCGTAEVLCYLGRVHAYEGHPLDQVVHAVRTAAAAGCTTLILTNASGAIRPGLHPGELVLIADHLNLTARSPLVGARFVDLTDVYSLRLRGLARVADQTLQEGVYAGLAGPHFETPAEIRMLRSLGADLVGMSTVHEAIAARAEGLEVLGISLVTNLAAGVGRERLDHRNVLAAGAEASVRMGSLLAHIVGSL